MIRATLAWGLVVASALAAEGVPPTEGPSRPVGSRGSELAPSLRARLKGAQPDEAVVAWVFLADRGNLPESELRRALRARERELSPRTLTRRSRARGPGEPRVGEYDLPLCPTYLGILEEEGASLRVRSRWLNAVSVSAAPRVLRRVAGLPFVSRLELVRARVLPGGDGGRAPVRPRPPARGRVHTPSPALLGEGRVLDYGASWSQNALIQVPGLHQLGLSGEGVRVAVIDTGFDLSHPAFDNLKVLAQWDFIHGDSITAYEAGEDASYQDHHGTKTLSVLAGYAPGHLIGPAYGAEFVLAKTEEVSFERPAEEDWWVAAIEWAEAEQGADVVSSSLGYVCMDDPWVGYTYEDLDGNTAVTTRAADMAASLGVFVATAVGNIDEFCPGYIHPNAPADGDSVAAVGAVTDQGVRAIFSSVGPTYDGRIKPDLMAPGVDTWSVIPGTAGDFGQYSGTSLATPLVAGVAALLLEARPMWTGVELLDTLRATATRAASPDTLYGWGLVRGARVLGIDSPGGAVGLLTVETCPNPFHGSTQVRLALPPDLAFDVPWCVSVCDVSGRRIRELARGRGTFDPPPDLSWQGDDDGGRSLPSGVYLVLLEAGSERRVAKTVLIR